jgi:predicted nucleic acid-binding protein
MSKIIIIDTNIFIDILKDKLKLKDFTSQYPKRFFCASFMTRVELLSAFDLITEGEEHIKKFISIVPIIQYTEKIEQCAIIIRRKSHLKIPDAFIVATAIVQDAVLITNDNQLLNLKWPGLEVQSLRQ